MTIAGALYSEEIPEESATRRMLARFPIWQGKRAELGAAASIPTPILNLIVLIDGCICNPEEIKEEVHKHDPALPFSSTEELIASLYTLHQERAFTYLNGDFALALYDEQKQELLLVRDRIGEKGLYWTLKNNLFLFANSLKSILSSRLIAQTPDLEALSFYISFGFIPQEKSPIQGVFKLQPGHYLKVTKEKNLLIRPYWTYNLLLNQKREEMTESAISHAAAKAWNGRISSTPSFCYTQCEEEKTGLQREAGIPLKFPSETNPFSVQTLLSDLDEMVWALDEPVADLALPHLWQTCKNLKAEGQTELFFPTGSLSHLIQEIHSPRTLFFKPLSSIERLIKKRMLIPLFYHLRPKSAYEMLRSIHTHPWHIAFLNQTALFDKREFTDLHSSLLKPVNNEIFLHRFPALERLGPTPSSLLYLFYKIKLPPSILLPQERFCSHFGITKKAPYLDMQIVKLLASIPDRGSDFCYAKLLTPINTRVCRLPSWTKEISAQILMEKLSKSVLVESGLLSNHWFTEQMKNFNRHPHLFFQELWGLLILETWFRLYIENNIN